MRTARHAPAKNATRSGRPSGGEGVTVTRCQDFQHVSRSLPSRLRSRTVPDQVRTNFRPRNTSSDIELTVAPMWVATMPLIVAAHAAHRGKAGGKMLSVDNGTRPCEQSGKVGMGQRCSGIPSFRFYSNDFNSIFAKLLRSLSFPQMREYLRQRCRTGYRRSYSCAR
jgi:hypothetical protein